jgi:hypothetical protein
MASSESLMPLLNVMTSAPGKVALALAMSGDAGSKRALSISLDAKTHKDRERERPSGW